MAISGHRRFGIGLLSALLAVTLVAGSCGGGDDSSSDDSNGSEAPGEPVSGGEFVFAVEAGNSGGWCMPEAQLAAAGNQMAQAIYEPLTAVNEDGDVIPFLAETLEPNEDFTLWTMTLRDGIKFHDGTDMDAEVVKNNIDAYRGTYPGRSPLLFPFVLADIDEVTVVDDMTIEIITKSSWPTFPGYLNLGGRFGIIAQAQLDDADTCESNLIGTGPFVLDEWVPNDHLTASKNPDYWQSDEDGTQLPYLDKITFKPIIEPAARTNALLSGEVDMLQGTSAIQYETLLAEEEGGNVRVYSTDEYAEVTYGMLNIAQPPFDNKNARLALAHAFDPEEFNEVIGLGYFSMASGPFAPGNIGYLEDAGFPEYDPAKAEEFAAAYTEETGQPLEFTLTMTNTLENQQTAQWFQAQAAEVGIKIDIEQIESVALINKSLSGDWQALGWRNHAGSDPDGQRLWWATDSPLNLSQIADPEMDSLMDSGRVETDLAARESIYQDVNRIFSSEAYNLWFNWTLWQLAMNPSVGGELGPTLPDGSGPFPGLSAQVPVSGLWLDQ